MTKLYPCLVQSLWNNLCNRCGDIEVHTLSQSELHKVQDLFRGFRVMYRGNEVSPHFGKTAIYGEVCPDSLTMTWAEDFGHGEEWYTKTYSLTEMLNKPYKSWVQQSILLEV